MYFSFRKIGPKYPNYDTTNNKLYNVISKAQLNILSIPGNYTLNMHSNFYLIGEFLSKYAYQQKYKWNMATYLY